MVATLGTSQNRQKKEHIAVFTKNQILLFDTYLISKYLLGTYHPSTPRPHPSRTKKLPRRERCCSCSAFPSRCAFSAVSEFRVSLSARRHFSQICDGSVLWCVFSFSSITIWRAPSSFFFSLFRFWGDLWASIHFLDRNFPKRWRRQRVRKSLASVGEAKKKIHAPDDRSWAPSSFFLGRILSSWCLHLNLNLSIALQLQFSGFTIASSVQCFTISLLDVHNSTHSASLRSTLLHTLSYSRCFSPLFFPSFLSSNAIANPQNLHSVVPYRSLFACPCAPCVRIPVVFSGFLLLSSSYSSVSWEVRLSSSVALTFHNFGILIRIILSSDSLFTQGFACKNSARSGWFGWRNKNSVAGNHRRINCVGRFGLKVLPRLLRNTALDGAAVCKPNFAALPQELWSSVQASVGWSDFHLPVEIYPSLSWDCPSLSWCM